MPAQTLRQAKAAYRRSNTTISEAERRRIARGAELQERADRLRDNEKKRKANKAKREAKEAEERAKTRELAKQGLKEEREMKPGGLLASQEVLGKYWGKKKAKAQHQAQEENEFQEALNPIQEEPEEEEARPVLTEKDGNAATLAKMRGLVPALSQCHMWKPSSRPSGGFTHQKGDKPSPDAEGPTSSFETIKGVSQTLKRKRVEVNDEPHLGPKASAPADHLQARGNPIEDRDEEEDLAALFPSDSQVEREITTPSSPNQLPTSYQPPMRMPKSAKAPARVTAHPTSRVSSRNKPHVSTSARLTRSKTSSMAHAPAVAAVPDPAPAQEAVKITITVTKPSLPDVPQDLVLTEADLKDLLCSQLVSSSPVENATTAARRTPNSSKTRSSSRIANAIKTSHLKPIDRQDQKHTRDESDSTEQQCKAQLKVEPKTSASSTSDYDDGFGLDLGEEEISKLLSEKS